MILDTTLLIHLTLPTASFISFLTTTQKIILNQKNKRATAPQKGH